MLIAETVNVPVMGIGISVDVDYQVLVTHDMVDRFNRLVRKWRLLSFPGLKKDRIWKLY